ncbi:secretin receptor-like isoform X2 [Rhynchophorus ferrugineus]
MAYNEHIRNLVIMQTNSIKLARENCIKEYAADYDTPLDRNEPIYNETLKRIFCPPFFDEIACWPPQPANTTAVSPCPSYIQGFLKENNATRQCMENGQWYMLHENNTYTNYSTCARSRHTQTFIKLNLTENMSDISENSLKIIKAISETGYTVSLISLLIAFTIMFKIKRLHCARNILHMNLFASFILRSFMHIFRDLTFEDGLGLSKDFITYNNGSRYFHVNYWGINFECKLIVSLVQYFTTANYSWILMEGLYLNNLILRALFTDSNKNLAYYISFGWGLPLLVVIPWVIAKIRFEDKFCWTTNESFKVYAIIAIPTLASVLLNFVLFVVISIVLYKKLKSPVNEDSRRYLKWAKSTLVLVPLFGVNYSVFLIFYFMKEELIWMICDTLFGSFQGFFVAILYCFLNGEVKAEMKPYFKNLMIFLATNNITRHCFPGREKYLSSAVGRQSVCTTLSCSSLYNNGISRRNSKTKSDQLSKLRLTNFHTDNPKEGCKSNTTRHSVPKVGQNGQYSYNVTMANGKYPINITTNLDISITNEIKPHHYSQNLPTCEEEIHMLGDDNPIVNKV